AGAAMTYGQRYLLKMIFNIAIGDDRDGNTVTGGASITEEQIGTLTELIESVGADKAKFLRFFKVEQLAELPSKRFQEAVTMLNAKSRG
ncbi:ERF family protein, partial [Bradyrhizobium sp. 61]|nr:ERF family protein [Bradyrhizobium sp. 61]